MTTETSEETLEAEVRDILSACPAVIVRRDRLGWLVGCGFAGIERSGHTGISADTSDDPRDLARRLLAQTLVAVAAPSEAEQSDEATGDGEQAEDAPDLGEELVAAEEEAGGGADHGGIMLQPPAPPDEIYALRDFVRGRISEEKLIRLDAAADPSRWAFLTQAFADYQNLAALQAPISPELEANYRAFLETKNLRDSVEMQAQALERSARDADKPTLQAMASALVWG